MAPKLPQVVISRDGRRALMLESLETELSSLSGFDGSHMDSIVRLRPRGDTFAAQFKISNTFRVMWNIKGQTLRWEEDFDSALPDLALIALGRFLDENVVPDDPVDGTYALRIPISTEMFDIFRQDPPGDEELRAYVSGKIYWTWKFKAEPTTFEVWEARRLKVEAADFAQSAFAKVGSLWQRASTGGYNALPALASLVENTVDPANASSESKKLYDVALSFAGEQRSFVNAVASTLRGAGVEVFYDEFADLWGKDLTKELERVYRTHSRFVVVFVSRAYVEKAWPNLERQHALAGRIERMDDSVLPARFDPIELPGLPATVGYLDIGTRSPEDIAALVLAKLRR